MTRSPFSPVVRSDSQSVIHCATTTAAAPPASASRIDSAMRGRSNWLRAAPSAARTANSRARAIVRARRRFARFEQAIRRTKAERPISIATVARALRDIAVPFSSTGTQVLPAFTAGKSAARRAPKSTDHRHRLGVRSVRRASSDDAEDCAAPIGGLLLVERERAEEIEPAEMPPVIQPGRQNADDLVRFAVDANGAADDVGLAAESVLPRALTEKHDAVISAEFPRAGESRAQVAAERAGPRRGSR